MELGTQIGHPFEKMVIFPPDPLSLARVLPEEQAMTFHHATVQLLFLSAMAQGDIQPTTAFQTTRVRSPDEDNWGKVKRVLSYLKGTLHMPLILLADSLTLSQWGVDTAYAMHGSCCGHAGAGMSFGQGMALGYSWKQKINTKARRRLSWLGRTTCWGISSGLVTLCKSRDRTWICLCSTRTT